MARTQEQVIQDAIEDVIEREGGFVDRKADRGGRTNFGITQPTLDAANERGFVKIKDVKDLTTAAARIIYRSLFVDEPRFAVIRDPDLFDLVIDRGVNMKPARVVKWLQKALGLEQDGVLGPKTQAALELADVEGRAPQIYRFVLAESVMHLGRLISGDTRDEDHDGRTDAAENASGWFNRSAEFIVRTP